MQENAREMKGQEIAKLETNVKRVDKFEYRVRSQSGNGEYQVIQSEFGWYCSCPDTTYRHEKCKHIFAVEISLELRRRIENAKRIVPLDYQSCLICGSEKVVRHGILHNKSGDLQRYSCKGCGKRFTKNLGFEKMHATPKAITSAMQLYFSGESLRNVQKFLKMQGAKVSHVTVYNWIGKYVGLMQKYLESKNFEPELGSTWRADELFVKIKGNPKYVYALMDDETRFWIAEQVADSKYTEDVRPLLKEGVKVAGKKPDMFITDGAPNFHEAYQKEYWSKVAPRTSHIKHIHLAGDFNNNKMERMNGEVRDREKVMRGIKKMDSPIFKGYQIYHNYIREHEGLKGKTPAEAANIHIEGSNKWLTIIQNASHVQSLNTREDVHVS